MPPEEFPGYDDWKTTPPDDVPDQDDAFGSDDYEMFDGER